MILRRRIELSPGGDNEFSIKNNLLLWPVVVSQATGGNGPTIARRSPSVIMRSASALCTRLSHPVACGLQRTVA
jgi:hypothetical protein